VLTFGLRLRLKAKNLTNGWSKKMLYSHDQVAPEYYSVDSKYFASFTVLLGVFKYLETLLTGERRLPRPRNDESRSYAY
jgi:hypothetical protein